MMEGYVMEAMKCLFVLLVAVLVVNEAKPTHRQPHCYNLIRGRNCTQDDDCACPRSHTSIPLICNYGLTCEVESISDTIMRRLPCFRVYKAACKTDADCPCNEAQLICEENECVRGKSMLA